MRYWKKVVTLIIFIIILSGLFLNPWDREVNYTPTSYEKELINYFKEIALKSEYDGNPEKVIKWEEPMTLFVLKKEEFKDQMSVIKETINEINRLSTDGFKIILCDNPSKSNAILYLCSKDKVAELNPDFYKMLIDGIENEISGLAYSEFSTKTFVIDMSLIFINTNEPIDVQESTILEEIIQSLGLAFDSEMYPNSIFYQKKYEQEIEIKEYSEMDKDIIRLLYHPKMKPGIDSIKVERVIKRILKSEKD